MDYLYTTPTLTCERILTNQKTRLSHMTQNVFAIFGVILDFLNFWKCQNFYFVTVILICFLTFNHFWLPSRCYGQMKISKYWLSLGLSKNHTLRPFETFPNCLCVSFCVPHISDIINWYKLVYQVKQLIPYQYEKKITLNCGKGIIK